MQSHSIEHWAKLKLIQLRRSVPRCYLFSSKFILGAATLLTLYFLAMDITLLIRVRKRGPLTPFLPASQNKTKNSDEITIRSSTNPSSVTTQHTVWVFWPMPVKKIMMAEGTHFFRSPIAEFVEQTLGFSTIFPFVGPNLISLTHCVLSVICIRFLISDALFWRQMGVCLFQFRNFLDSFDGVVYRAHAKSTRTNPTTARSATTWTRLVTCLAARVSSAPSLYICSSTGLCTRVSESEQL
jgi:hypothetical protein